MKLPDWLTSNGLYNATFDNDATSNDPKPRQDLTPVTNVDDANLIGSRWLTGSHELHKIFLDIDVPHYYKPSRTEGHAHLMLNINLTREELKTLTTIFIKLGITGHGNYSQILNDGQLFLRINEETPQ